MGLTKEQADVYDLLVTYKKMRPSKILSFLVEKKEYKNLAEGTLPVKIIRALKVLVEEGLAQGPEIDNKRHTWYSITPEGVKQASLLRAYSKLENDEPTKKITINVPEILKPLLTQDNLIPDDNVVKKRFTGVLNDFDTYSKAEVNTALYLDAPKDIVDKVSEDFVSSYVNLAAKNLVEELKNSMFRVTEKICKRYGASSFPQLVDNIINRLKETLDFEVMLFFHFNGKKLLEDADWERIKKRHEEHIEIEFKDWPEQLRKINVEGKTRDIWMRWQTHLFFQGLNNNFKKLDLIVKPGYSRSVIDKDIDTVINTISEHIVLLQGGEKKPNDFYPEPAKREQIEKILREMIDDGSLEICTTLKINKEKIQERHKKIVEEYLQETGKRLFPDFNF